MAETTISWTAAPDGTPGFTFNPWIGCTRISPACDGCYAAHMMETRMGVALWGGPGIGAGTRTRTSKGNWSKPLTWNKKAAANGTRPFVFCASLADVFDNEVPAEWRRDLFDLIRATPNLTWLLLTKRPGMIVKLYQETTPSLSDPRHYDPFDSTLRSETTWPSNAAIGCTVVNQEEADRDIPKLLHAKTSLKPAFCFLSMEPLLGPVDLSWHMPGVDWVITGGETDQGAFRSRPSNPGWFRRIRDVCAEWEVPYHHKQNGEWLESMHMQQERILYRPEMEVRGSDVDGLFYKVGKAHAGRRLDCVEHNGRPQC